MAFLERESCRERFQRGLDVMGGLGAWYTFELGVWKPTQETGKGIF
jgi:hypothetical protein